MVFKKLIFMVSIALSVILMVGTVAIAQAEGPPSPPSQPGFLQVMYSVFIQCLLALPQVILYGAAFYFAIKRAVVAGRKADLDDNETIREAVADALNRKRRMSSSEPRFSSAE